MAGVGVWQGVGVIGWRRGDAPTLALPRRGRGFIGCWGMGVVGLGGRWGRGQGAAMLGGAWLYYLGAQDVLAVG